MKKTYIAPESTSYVVSAQHFMEGSIQVGNGPASTEYGDGRNGGDTDVKEEKGNFFWN